MSGVYWEEAPEEVIDMAEEVIGRYHPELEKARIGFIMRSEAPKAGTRYTLGEAKKVSDRDKVHIPYDFIIWLAADKWLELTPSQRIALVDHELEHCQWDGFSASIRLHDLEEFSCILERHGYWWPHAYQVAEIAKQATLWEPDGEGGVSAVRVAGVVGEFARSMDALCPAGWELKVDDQDK